MRSKAPLAMMEQMVMILVFALAAALCLQAFVKSDQMSRESENRDRAVAIAQNAAEAIRHTGGDFERAAALLGTDHFDVDSLCIGYDKDWEMTQELVHSHYRMDIHRFPSDVDGLGKARIWILDKTEDKELLSVDVAWQEVDAHG